MRYFADYIKGKPYQKTVLWENSSPSSTFAGQTVTLSDDITNYDQIRLEACFSSSYPSVISVSEMPVSRFKETAKASIKPLGAVSLCNNPNASPYHREWFYTDDTHVTFYSCYDSTGASFANSALIPLRIIGIKKGLGEVKNVETINKNAVRGSSFTAIVGHRYIVAFASLYGEGGTPSAHITGLDIITASNIARTAQYSSLDTTLQVVIGIATSTTVTCTHRTSGLDTYADICAIDLDDQ